MLTGRRAFEGTSQASLVGAILKDVPKPISGSPGLLPRSLERVVLTCLEKRPEDRWQTMRDLRRELTWQAESSHDAHDLDTSVPIAARWMDTVGGDRRRDRRGCRNYGPESST